MSTILQNSIWPNAGGTLGEIKAQIPDGVTIKWPDGDALVGNFVYEDGKLVGFVDTKALTVNDSGSTTFPYDYVNIQVDKSLEGTMTFNKGERTKYLTITYNESINSDESFDFVIINFNTTDQETINTVRTAKRVVDNKLYDADDNLIGTWDTSKIEIGGTEYFLQIDGLFCNTTDRGLIISEFDSDLSSLREGAYMFSRCFNLTSFSSDLSSLWNSYKMFSGCSNLTSFNVNLPSLETGSTMFQQCTNLTSFNVNLPSLTNSVAMFQQCTNLTSFSSDLSSLTNGNNMFEGCNNLTSFTSDLSSLTNGNNMFEGCKLDTASVQNIADTINTYNERIDISIGNLSPNEQEIAAFNKMVSKGWTVYVNGSQYTPTSPAAITTLDENGEETVTPIPFYAKLVQSDEEHAQYVDEQGNFYNILGGQFIYGDDLSTYGMFTCEEDAATNMGLTKIEKL